MAFLRWFGQCLLALACAMGAAAAMADGYPSRPVKLVLPYPPGGVSDNVVRLLARELEVRLKQPVVVENRAGASTLVATEHVARSAPDGYTLLVLTSSTPQAATFAGKDFDVKRDFKMIANMLDTPVLIVVNPNSLPNVQTFAQLLQAVKSGKLSYTTTATGSTGHLAMEMVKKKEGIVDFPHVAYKGAVPAIQDLLAGQVPIMFADLGSVQAHIKAGKLRPIAVAASQRISMLPDVPTVIESGVIDFEAMTFFGIAAPPGTPDDVVSRLSAEVKAIMAEPEFRAKVLAPNASILNYMDGPAFGERLDAFHKRWVGVAREAGIDIR